MTVSVSSPATEVVPGQAVNVTVTVTCGAGGTPSGSTADLTVTPALATVTGTGTLSGTGMVATAVFLVTFSPSPTTPVALSLVGSFTPVGAGSPVVGVTSVLLAPPVVTVGAQSEFSTISPGGSDQFYLTAKNGSAGAVVPHAVFNYTVDPSSGVTLYPTSTITGDSSGRATIWVNASAGISSPTSLLLNVTAWAPGHEQGSGAGSVAVASSSSQPTISATLQLSRGTVRPGYSITIFVNATQGGTPLTGATVLLSATPHPSGTVLPASAFTNPSGEATFTFNATKTLTTDEPVLFEATVNDSGYGNGSAVGSATVDPPFLAIGGSSTPTPVDEGVPAVLTFGTQGTAGPVAASMTVGITPASAGTLNTTSGSSGALGVWTVTFDPATTSTTPFVAEAQLVATAPGYRSTPYTLSFTISPSPLALVAPTLPTSAAAGSILPLSGTLTNVGSGSSEVGGLVTFVLVPSWAATVSPASVLTNSTGGYSTSLTIDANLTTGVALTVEVEASAAGAMDTNASVVLLAYGSTGTAPASQLTLRISATSVVPGETLALTTQVLNATDSAPLTDVPVTLSVTSPSSTDLGILSPGSLVDTNATGVASWTFTVNSTLTEPVAALVTALAVPAHLGAASTSTAFEVVPSTDHVGLAVQAPASLTAGEAAALKATVTLTSPATGQVTPVVAALVTGEAVGGGQITFGTTGENGVATLNFTAPLVSATTAVLIEAQVDVVGQVVNQTVRINIQPLSLAAAVSFTGGVGNVAPGASVPTVVTVTSGGVAVSGAQVSLSVIPSWAGSVRSESGTTTGTTGQVTFSLTTVSNVSSTLAVTVVAVATDPGHWNSTAESTIVLAAPSSSSGTTLGSVLTDPVDLFLLALVILLAILLAASTFYGFERDETDRREEEEMARLAPSAPTTGSEASEAEAKEVPAEVGGKEGTADVGVKETVTPTDSSAKASEGPTPPSTGRLVSIGKGQWTIQDSEKSTGSGTAAASVTPSTNAAPEGTTSPEAPAETKVTAPSTSESAPSKESVTGSTEAPSSPSAPEATAATEPTSTPASAEVEKPAEVDPSKVKAAPSERRDRRKERRGARKKDAPES